MQLVPHEEEVKKFHKEAFNFMPIRSEGAGHAIVGWAFRAPDPKSMLADTVWFWMTADGQYVTQDVSESCTQASNRCHAFLQYQRQSHTPALEVTKGSS